MNTKAQTKTSPKKDEPKQPVSKSLVVQESQPEQTILKPEEIKAEITPKPEPVKSMSLTEIQAVVEGLSKIVTEHSQQILALEETLARKRKPTSNSKIQIRDKQTGKVYPSKNSVYQSLLKADQLKELVDKCVFGDNPEKNTFGWYALVRAWPDRFEERKVEEVAASK